MRKTILIAAFLMSFCLPVAGQEGESEDDAIKALKKILEKMETVEKLLAKARLEDGAAGQQQVDKDIKELIDKGKIKESEVLDDISRQLKVVGEKMKDIDLDIDKIIQSVKMSQGQGQSGMDIKMPKGQKDQEKPKGKREDQEKSLEENKPGKEEQGDPAKGKHDPKEDGSKKTGEGGSEGSDPAKKPYTAKGSQPPGGARRAAGEGRWGFLPEKEYREALAQNDLKVPEKYKALIRKFWELMAKKADEESRK